MDQASKVENFYDRFASKQVRTGINHRHFSIQMWLEKVGLKRSSKVLEIGTGVGTQTELMLLFLNSKGYVLANDISKNSLDIAKERLKKFSNVKFLHGDIVRLKIEEKFNAIVLPDVLEHIPIECHKGLFSKLEALLTDDGFILIHIPNPDYLDWVRQNHSDQLQIIDQSITTEWIIQCSKAVGLYLDFMQTYSIYQKPADYRVLVLKKHRKVDYVINKNVPTDNYSRRGIRVIRKLLKRF